MYEKLKDEQYRNLLGIDVEVSKYQSKDGQFQDLRNFTFTRPGSLTSRNGMEYFATLSRATFLIPPKSLFQFSKTTGESYTILDSGANLYILAGPTLIYPSLTANLTTSLPIDFQAINDKLYFFNGTAAGVFNGSLSYQYFMPSFVTYMVGAGITFNTSLTTGATAVLASGTFFGGFLYMTGTTQTVLSTEPDSNLDYTSSGTKYGGLTVNPRMLQTSLGATVVSAGKWIIFGFTIPDMSNISLLIPASARQATGATNIVFGTPQPFYLTLNAGGVTVYHMEYENFTANQFDTFLPQTYGRSAKYIQSYNNFLFFAGIPGVNNEPNTIYYSNLGSPDASDAENFFQVKATFGDVVTGLFNFQDALLIFKQNSIFELRGSNPDVFSVREVSTEYGCLNNRGICQFENRIWFVDKKGIIEYDGANVKMVSESIATYLNQVDKSTIRAMHVKDKNQVWFCSNDKCFVFDYFVEAWTIFDNVSIDSNVGAEILDFGSTRSDVSFFKQGTSTQNGIRFGDSLVTDLGLPITLMAKTKYHKRMGETTEELWRRFFLNVDVPASSQSVTLRMYPNYGDSVSYTVGTTLYSFQPRLDFGLPAKSLSVEFIIHASQTIRVNGYTIESRYLRSV